MRITRHIIVLLAFSSFTSCNWHKDRLDIDISGIRIDNVRINRYDRDLFNVPVDDLRHGLESIRNNYLFFLGTDLSDTLKLAEMRAYLQNPRNIDFHKACEAAFPDLIKTEQDLTEAFRYFFYYFPQRKIPVVHSYISGGDYDAPVRLADSVMIIALDTYLGESFMPYLSDGLPLYRVKRMTAGHIVPGCMSVMISRECPSDRSAVRLIDLMIDTGKQHYLLDAVLPVLPGHLKFGYTPEQFDWIRKNESHVWAAIIENRMLYSSDAKIIQMFFSDGPNTPEFGKESPPRMGEFIGWKIIKSFLDNHPDIPVQQIIPDKDYQSILTQSGYKPSK